MTLTDCNTTINVDSSYSKNNKSSVGLWPTDTILIRTLKTIEICLSSAQEI